MNYPYRSLSELFRSGCPQAVLWDMDGVLCDTMSLHFHALRMACSARQLYFPKEILIMGIGRTDQANLSYIFSQNRLDVQSSANAAMINTMISEKENIFYELLEMNPLQPNPGVLSWLKMLVSKKIPCAIASSSTMGMIVSMVDKIGISQYFDALISGAHLSTSKPDPDIFLRAAGALLAVPEHCLVIEDAPIGIEAARRAGMKCLAVGTTVSLDKLSEADIIVPGLDSYPPDRAFL